MKLRRVLVALLVLLAIALAAATAARAEIVVKHDGAGRAITFDVRAAGADVDWYAALLGGAIHGNEIGTLTVRIVPQSEIQSWCGAAALACYGRNVMIVPNGKDAETAYDVLHEYGHHLDFAWPVSGAAREPNGTPAWWNARGMAALLTGGQVAFDYSLGWAHSIGEIFAEDYAWIQMPLRYGIQWLAPPDATLKATMVGELGAGAPATPPVVPPLQPTTPVVLTGSGTLRPGATRSFPFGLRGPGRHVTFTVTVSGSQRAGTRARLQVVCDGAVVQTKALVRGRRSATIEAGGLGPASCEATVRSTSRRTLTFAARLQLAIE